MIEFEIEFEFERAAGAGLAPEDAGSRRRRAGWMAAFVVAIGFGAVLGVPAGLSAQGTAAEAMQAGVAQTSAAAPAAQAPQAVLGQDTARVGDVVAVGVRVVTAPGERVVWPDTLPLGGVPAENAARVVTQVDTLDDGRLAATGVYAVTPWRVGALAVPEVAVQVVGGDESPRMLRTAVPSLEVVSVLPPDTAGLEPRPARGVLGASWDWLAIGLWTLLAVALLSVLVWWWRRRRGPVQMAAPAPLIPPRERALAALQEAREAGLLERGEWKAFYTRVSEAVREYAAALEHAWGEDLTTTELLSRFRAEVGAAEAAALGEVLRPADQVKFARRVPDRSAAEAEWEAARSWVRRFDWPPRMPAEEAA